MSSRYPFLTLSYYRERDALKGQGEAEPHKQNGAIEG